MFTISAFAIPILAGIAWADPVEEHGRDLIARVQAGVVAVKLTVKESMAFEGQSTRKHDSIIDVTGTCIDPSGLIVVSLRTIDRSEMLGSFSMGGDEDNFKSKFESEIAEAKIIVPGSDEVPAKVVMRDKDLDLAFLRPVEKPAKPFDFVDLKNPTKLKLLEQFFVVDRMGKEEGRVPVILLSRVGTILEKPRTFYISGDLIATLTLGSPAFTADGKVVGIIVYRISPTGRKKDGGGNHGPVPGIIPAADVMEVVKQIPADAKAEKK
jgi:S1-C subfamily serine protease